MPGQDDQDLFNDTGDEGETGTGSDGGDADALPTGQDLKDGSKDSKRINDLMSRAQKAEARAEKAEKTLKAAGSKSSDADAGNAAPPAVIPPEIAQWLETAKDAARERIYNADTRFAKYGLDLALVDGEKPDEMRSAASRLSATIDVIESKVRNEVLVEHGLTPAAAGGSTAPKMGDIATMSDEEFEKLVRRGSQGAFVPR